MTPCAVSIAIATLAMTSATATAATPEQKGSRFASRDDLLSSVAQTLADKIRSELQGYEVSSTSHTLTVSWNDAEQENNALPGAAEKKVVRRTMGLFLVAPTDLESYQRQYRINDELLRELRLLQGKMEMFSERHFASSRYSYAPRNAKERSFMARCRQLLSRLKPLAGYRIDGAANIIIRGDLLPVAGMRVLHSLLSPLNEPSTSKDAVIVYSNFWLGPDIDLAPGSKDCNPVADYSQTRAIPVAAQ